MRHPRAQPAQAEVLPLDEAVVELREAEGEAGAADRNLSKVLK